MLTLRKLVFPIVTALAPLCLAQSAPEKFEVASVKINPYSKANCVQESRGCSIPPAWGGATFTATNVSLDLLAQIAYGVDSNQISGAERLAPDRYDVSARPASGLVTYERARPMLRVLLEERFGLKTHHESREVSGYALLVAKGGPKLGIGNGKPKQFVILPDEIRGYPGDLGMLASQLSRIVGKPVANKTGLDGSYDLELRFAKDGDMNSRLPSIFTALQEQMGLRLEAQKVPVDYLVIDECNKTPTEN